MKCTPKVGQKCKTFGGAFFMAKKGQVFRKYSPQFQLSVIPDMRENHLSYSETVRKYWHTEKKAETNNHRSQVKNRERKFLADLC